MAGALAQTANQAAMMLTLAQIAPVHVVGQYALGLAIATPLNVFADRVVRTLQATAVHDDFPVGDYLAVRTLVGLGAIIICVFIVSLWQLGSWTGQIVLLVALGRLVEGIAQTLYGRLQRGHQMRQIGQSQVLRALLAMGASLGCLLIWQRLDAALVASILANVVVLHRWDRPRIEWLVTQPAAARAGVSINWRGVAWRHMFQMGLPLAVSTFFVSLSVNIPRLFLSRSESESTLGVFAVLCYLCLPATMVVSAILQAATPQLALCYREGPAKNGKRLVRRLTLICAAIAAINGGLIHVFGPLVLRLALSEEYASAADDLDAIAAAIGLSFVASVPATAMTAQRRFRMSVLACGALCATTVLAGAVLIPRLGMAGAAWAMMLSSGVHGIVSSIVLQYIRPTRRRGMYAGEWRLADHSRAF
jgi:O-antigen/teichoic acid export membrane protein